MTNDIEVVILDEVNCAACGIRFGIAQPLMERRRKDGKYFYCPNGHSNFFPPKPKPRDEEVEDLKERLESIQRDLRQARDELATARAWADQIAEARRPLFRRHPSKW